MYTTRGVTNKTKEKDTMNKVQLSFVCFLSAIVDMDNRRLKLEKVLYGFVVRTLLRSVAPDFLDDFGIT